MRLRAMVMTILVVAVLGACGGNGTGSTGFSATTRSRYMEGCTSSQSEAFCQCTLNELEKRFTEEEFLRFAIDASEQPPDELIEVSLACLAEAELGG